MADPINLNQGSPGSFVQPTQKVENSLVPAQSNPSTAASSAPPTAGATTSTPLTQAGGGARQMTSPGLGGGVTTSPQQMGGTTQTLPLMIGDALLPGTPGPSTGGGGSSGGGGGGYTTIQDNTGAVLTQRSTLQFGAGLNASDNGTITVGVLDVGHANTWTALQKFAAGIQTDTLDSIGANFTFGGINAQTFTGSLLTNPVVGGAGGNWIEIAGAGADGNGATAGGNGGTWFAEAGDGGAGTNAAAAGTGASAFLFGGTGGNSGGGGASGDGGWAQNLAGNGGAGSGASNAGNGGFGVITGGAGGTAASGGGSTGTGGAGGRGTVQGGVGGNASTGSGAAGTGGLVAVNAGAGGASTATGAGGAGGLAQLHSGAGAAATANGGVAGLGGTIDISCSAGGDGATNRNAANGGALTIQSGGGGNGVGATSTAGNGGLYTMRAGAGGNAAGAGGTAGVGGTLALVSGAAGVANGGTGAVSGDVTIDVGASSGAAANGHIRIGEINPPAAINIYSGLFDGSNTTGHLVTIAPTAALTGTQGSFRITGPASTNQTASTEVNGALYDFSATRTWVTGALATEREVLFKAPTYAFAGASVVTNAATLAIDNAPHPGANATLTNAYALWVQAGTARFDGGIQFADGTTQTTSAAGKSIFFDYVDYASTNAPSAAGGNFTVGHGFAVFAPSTITGVKFFYPDAVARNIKVSIWDPSNTRILTNTASYNSAGIKTVVFAPTAISQANCWQLYHVSMWDTAGGIFINTAVGTNMPNIGTATIFINGPNYLSQSPAFANGDAVPTGGFGSVDYPIEPIFTTP